jgi:hypothetical protein
VAIVISDGVGAADIVGAGDDSSEIIAVDKSRELTIDQDSGQCIHSRRWLPEVAMLRGLNVTIVKR